MLLEVYVLVTQVVVLSHHRNMSTDELKVAGRIFRDVGMELFFRLRQVVV